MVSGEQFNKGLTNVASKDEIRWSGPAESGTGERTEDLNSGPPQSMSARCKKSAKTDQDGSLDECGHLAGNWAGKQQIGNDDDNDEDREGDSERGQD
jgi:hypothetical protein